MSIVLHIERLLIDEALLGGQRPALVRAEIERELAQRLAQSGASTTLAGLGHVVSLPPGWLSPGTSGTFGHRLARTLSDAMGVPTDRGNRHG